MHAHMCMNQKSKAYIHLPFMNACALNMWLGAPWWRSPSSGLGGVCAGAEAHLTPGIGERVIYATMTYCGPGATDTDWWFEIWIFLGVFFVFLNLLLQVKAEITWKNADRGARATNRISQAHDSLSLFITISSSWFPKSSALFPLQNFNPQAMAAMVENLCLAGVPWGTWKWVPRVPVELACLYRRSTLVALWGNAWEAMGKFSWWWSLINVYLVGGLEHFLFFHILGTIIPLD